MKKTITIAITVALVIGSNIVLAESSDVPLIYVPSRHHLIVLAAEEFHAPEEQLITVATCESGLNQSAVGRQGEIGIFQYFQSTWDDMSKAMGEKLDIHSVNDQVKLTSWVYANKPQWKQQWSTWRVWYGEGKHRCHA